MSVVVAIDGPVASGKTTVARQVASRLGFSLLDTGAIYRALALFCDDSDIEWSDETRVASATHQLPIRFEQDGDRHLVWLDERDVSREIRTPEISQGASIVSAIPEVRRGLLDLQRRLGSQGDIVAEGRDIGTVVFPDAEVKVFLTAQPEVRARRRLEELLARGKPATYANVLRELTERDQRDSNRSVAPLVPADDAVVLDSSAHSIDEVTRVIVERVRDHQAEQV